MKEELKSLKQKMLDYRDYYGWSILYVDEIENATTKEELAEIFDRYHNHLEDCCNDAQRGLKGFKRDLGLHELD